MDYNEWSAQYLKEAEQIMERVGVLRLQAKAADADTADRLYRRTALLYDMYLDCRHIGNVLKRFGGRKCRENRT